jgi:hypothetical protein
MSLSRGLLQFRGGGEEDEDITLSDTHNPPTLVIQGPITRARA